MDASTVLPGASFTARALLLGERIDLRSRFAGKVLARNPLTIPVEGAGSPCCSATVPSFCLTSRKLRKPPSSIRCLRWCGTRYEKPETEDVAVRIDPAIREGMQGDAVYFESCRRAHTTRGRGPESERWRSPCMSRVSRRLSTGSSRSRAISSAMDASLRVSSELHKHIGGMLLSEQMMVGRVEISEKPDMLWDNPGLEGLYLRMGGASSNSRRYAASSKPESHFTHGADRAELLHSKRP